MQESETCFDNIPMPAFRIPIMFRRVGRCSEMSYTMDHKSYEFTPHYRCKDFNGGGDIIFNKLLEGNKG